MTVEDLMLEDLTIEDLMLEFLMLQDAPVAYYYLKKFRFHQNSENFDNTVTAEYGDAFCDTMVFLSLVLTLN